MKQRRRERVKVSTFLMLTPMLDMLTVVLIFLIVNFSPDKAAIKKADAIQLPEAEQAMNDVPKIQIEITKEYIKLNGQNLEGLQPDSNDQAAWALLKTKLKEISNESPNQKPEPILLIADRETPYRFVDSTVAHLAAGGYSDVYLLTSRTEQKEY